MPSSPVFDLVFKQTAKGLHKARYGKCGGGLHAAAEAETQNRFAGQRADQGDIAGARARVLQSERAVAVKILPTVAFADIARAGRAECVPLSVVDGRKRETEGALLGRKHASRSIALDFRGIVVALATEPRSDEHIGPQGRALTGIAAPTRAREARADSSEL